MVMIVFLFLRRWGWWRMFAILVFDNIYNGRVASRRRWERRAPS
jgi:hypothetical protein